MHEPEIQRLLVDLGWLRDLARRLVADHDAVDDLVQETMAIALQQPAPPLQWRAWLTMVMRNVLFARGRQRQREQRHRSAVRGGDAAEDAATVLVRAETQHLVAHAVFELEEPYRSTVLLRFFEGLPPRAIAARQGVPVATVNSRMQRALQQLRERLDREVGSRAKWQALLLPLLRHDGAPTTAGVAVAWRWAAAAIVTVVTTFGIWVAVWPSAPSAPSTVAVTQPVSQPSVAVVPDPPAAVPRDERSAAPSGTVAEADEGYPVRGRLIDLEGRPLVGERVMLIPGDTTRNGRAAVADPAQVISSFARSRDDGTFAGSSPVPEAMFAIGGPRYQSVLIATWSAAAAEEAVVVAAPAILVAGRVLDPQGLPVVAGTVSFELPDNALEKVARSIADGAATFVQATIRRDGTFDLRSLPSVPGARLLVRAAGHPPQYVPAPASTTKELRIVIEAAAPEPDQLRGTVVDARGVPVAGALVAMGVTSVTTDAGGRFALALHRAGSIGALVAAVPGFLPATMEPPIEGRERAGAWPRDLVLQLGAPCGSVRGRVMDGEVPVAGVEVWIDDPTPFAVAGEHPLQLEYFLAGAPLTSRGRPLPDADPRFRDRPAPADRKAPGLVAHEVLPTASWAFVRTDADGWFTLSGLLARDYSLRAFDPDRLRWAAPVQTRAGHEPQLQLAALAPAARWRGVVLDHAQQPVADVEVRQEWTLFTRTTRVPSGRFELRMARAGEHTTTDARGRFSLATTGGEQAMLWIRGERILPESVDGSTIDPQQPGMLVVDHRCRVEVELADPTEADQLQFLDSGRVRLRCYTQQTDGLGGGSYEMPLLEGRSGKLVTSDRAIECRLLRDGKVVRTVPLVPVRDGVTRIQ